VGKPSDNTEVHILDDDDNDLGPNEVGRIYVRNRAGGDFEYLGDEEKTASVHLGPAMYTFGDIGYVDDDDNDLGPNEVGRIYVRNRADGDFESLGDEEKTSSVHLGPAMYTFGDIGYVDDDGYLYLSDRQIDMIISGGVNIYPAEIEAALAAHELVADVSVFGVPNEEFGEEVKAAVELVDGTDPAAAEVELRNVCRENLAGYMVPRSFDFGPLPRTPTGKLPKRLLRAKYWEGTGRNI
jgi:long-chain acyl-CoA synthetase